MCRATVFADIKLAALKVYLFSARPEQVSIFVLSRMVCYSYVLRCTLSSLAFFSAIDLSVLIRAAARHSSYLTTQVVEALSALGELEKVHRSMDPPLLVRAQTIEAALGTNREAAGYHTGGGKVGLAGIAYPSNLVFLRRRLSRNRRHPCKRRHGILDGYALLFHRSESATVVSHTNCTAAQLATPTPASTS